MKKFFSGILISVLVFLFLCELTLPDLVALVLERQVVRGGLRVEQVKARVYAFPAAKIFFGRADGVFIEMEGALLGGCRASLLSLKIPPGKVSVQDLIAGDLPVAFQALGPVQARFVFTEHDLNSYLQKKGLKGVLNPRLELTDRGIQISGEVAFWGSTFAFQLLGNLVPGNDGEIAFSPIDITVDGERLPPELAKKVLSSLQFNPGSSGFADLKLPFLYSVQTIDVDEDKLVIEAVLCTASKEKKVFKN